MADTPLSKKEYDEVKNILSNKEQRMSYLLFLLDKQGNTVKYIRNRTQQIRADTQWPRKIDLKTRQQGSSTEYLLDSLDMAFFIPNQKIGIIAHKKDCARELIEKAVFAYEHFPELLQEANPIISNNKGGIEFQNGSSIWAATSYRSGTLQRLIVSEYGYICKRLPDRAQEIKNGALNSVSPDCEVIFESTSCGKGGDYEDMVMKAKKHQEMGLPLTKMHYKLLFIPWMLDTTCQISPEGVPIYPRHQEYFDSLKAKGIELDASQRAWWTLKEAEQGPAIKMDYPSTIEESFESTIEGTYFQNEMQFLRLNHRITQVPHQKDALVSTGWDLGVNDETAIWFCQRIGREYHLIDYYANKDKGLDYYYDILMKKGYRYDKHILPHDISVREIGNMGLSRFESFERLFGRGNAVICPRIPLADGINAARKFLPQTWFDLEATEEGVDSLDSYTKVWNNKLGTFQDTPLHNYHSNAADAFRYLAIYMTMYEQIQTRQQARAPGSGLGSKRRPWGRAYT